MKRGRVGCKGKKVVYWKLQVLIQVSSMPKVKFFLSSKTKNKRNFFEQVTLHDLNKCWTVPREYDLVLWSARPLSTTGSQTCMKELTYPSFQQSWGLSVRPLNWGRLNFKSRNQITPKCWVQMKVARAEDQEAWKKWVKLQAIVHSYGQDDEGDDEPGDVAEVTVISNRTCRCGSTSHKRTTHRSCPLNTKK